MDYQKLIDEFFNEKSNFIIEEFNCYKNDNEPFEDAIVKIRAGLDEDREGNVIHINKDIFHNCQYDFNHHEKYYEKGSPIAFVIDKKIKKEYQDNIFSKKIMDKNNNEIANYSFENLIHDLIEYDSLFRIEGRLNSNSELYRLFYNSNNYDQFTLEAIDEHVINSDLYRDLFSKFNPNISIPEAIKSVDVLNNIHYDIVTNKEETNKPTIKIGKKIKIKKQEFELDEQAVILNLCLEDINSIPLTEKVKLLIIIGEIKEDLIFKESSAKNLFYSKVSKGISRKGSGYTMIEIIDSILIKIEKYDLIITNQTLKKHKAKLFSEQK